MKLESSALSVGLFFFVGLSSVSSNGDERTLLLPDGSSGLLGVDTGFNEVFDVSDLLYGESDELEVGLSRSGALTAWL